MSTEPSALAYAAAPYLNAAPLVEGLAASDRARLVYDVPSALPGRLRAGSADAALVPVVEYLFSDDLDIIEGLGVCADGNVRSVKLRCRKPIDEVRTVAADPASRTSNLLAAVLLANHFGSNARVEPCRQDRGSDAEVVIGDRALACVGDTCEEYDLAGEWKELTGLPFVFAVWAYPKDHPRARELGALANDSLDAGLQAFSSIAERYARQLALPATDCLDYLQNCVHYRLGPAEIKAMERFRELAKGLPG